MLEAALVALQDSAPAVALRTSLWVYPFVNAGHILGLALLFGAIVSLDLRLAGVSRAAGVAPLARVLVPVAVTGLVLAITTGALMFSVDAVKYANQPLFLVKLVLISLAIANALVLRRAYAWRECFTSNDPSTARDGRPPALRLRWAGAASIALWTGAILCGRLIGYL